MSSIAQPVRPAPCWCGTPSGRALVAEGARLADPLCGAACTQTVPSQRARGRADATVPRAAPSGQVPRRSMGDKHTTWWTSSSASGPAPCAALEASVRTSLPNVARSQSLPAVPTPSSTTSRKQSSCRSSGRSRPAFSAQAPTTLSAGRRRQVGPSSPGCAPSPNRRRPCSRCSTIPPERPVVARVATGTMRRGRARDETLAVVDGPANARGHTPRCPWQPSTSSFDGGGRPSWRSIYPNLEGADASNTTTDDRCRGHSTAGPRTQMRGSRRTQPAGDRPVRAALPEHRTPGGRPAPLWSASRDFAATDRPDGGTAWDRLNCFGDQALVAQLDRASDYGSEGWGFESLRAHSEVFTFWTSPSPRLAVTLMSERPRRGAFSASRPSRSAWQPERSRTRVGSGRAGAASWCRLGRGCGGAGGVARELTAGPPRRPRAARTRR